MDYQSVLYYEVLLYLDKARLYFSNSSYVITFQTFQIYLINFLNAISREMDSLCSKYIPPYTLVSRISVQARISVQGGILTKIK